MNLPQINKSERSREFDAYPDIIKDRVVYNYLFEGKSHRQLDKNIIGLESESSRGWQSMGILHYLGLKDEFKGIFKGSTISAAIELLSVRNDDYKSIALYLNRYRLNQYNPNDLLFFNKNPLIKPLIKIIGTSQFTDGVRIDKEYHQLFNPSDSIFFTPRGTARKVKVLFNNKVFDAEYRYEGQRDERIELQSIRFKKDLKEEYLLLFPDVNGSFSISIGFDLNHFIFDIITNQNIDIYKIEDEIDDPDEYPEGRESFKTHRILERNPKVIKLAKKEYMKIHGRLFCEICNFSFGTKYGERGKDYIEGHHKKMVSEMKSGEKTKIEDIVMLCSNCHRMIHRRPIISIEEMKKIVDAKHLLQSY